MSGLTAKRSNRLLFVVGITALAVCLSACRPHGILSSRQMRSLLVDLHKTDALLQVTGLSHGHNEAEDLYYAMVLEQHGITQAQFDSSLVWYTAHPQLFDKIYPKVLAQLTQEREDFMAMHAEEFAPVLRDEKQQQHPTLTPEQAQRQMDSILWMMRYGIPVFYWNDYPSVENLEDQLLP